MPLTAGKHRSSIGSTLHTEFLPSHKQPSRVVENVRYTSNEFVRYKVVKQLAEKYPVMKPLARVDKNKIYSLKKTLAKSKIAQMLLVEEQAMSDCLT